ncbi:Hypothetical predicted protein [Pelobates cultripes]|uniref:Uncharacterized protein n=1 Tax=Pelobates cultripes TaxID=61616 RepID=A0AAD1VYJ4_PELCU|nr:Hypothetical predicted protein [Pelobates cultripes]
MTYRFEGDAYRDEVMRRLTRYGPNPSTEAVMATVRKLDVENRAAWECPIVTIHLESISYLRCVTSSFARDVTSGFRPVGTHAETRRSGCGLFLNGVIESP